MTGLVTQAAWAKELGVSTTTFRQWRGLGLIPLPLDLPGYPRWSREVVDHTTARLLRTKRGLFGRIRQSKGGKRALQSSASRVEQSSRSLHGAGVSGELVSDVHDRSVGDGAISEQSNSLAGVR